MDKNVEKGYKLCRRHLGGKLTSAFPRGPTRVYKVGKWTHPRKGDGPLAVFSDFESARSFIETSCPPIMLVSSWVIKPCLYIPSHVKLLWYKAGLLGQTISFQNVPVGTRFAKAVMLCERRRK